MLELAIIPIAPNNNPPLIITKNISIGCDFTLLENINGYKSYQSIVQFQIQ